MRMRHAAWALALLLVPAIAIARHHNSQNFNLNIHGDKDRITCADIDMDWNDHASDGASTVRREQTVPITSSGALNLRVRAPERGGIRVQTSTDGSASALVCMAASAGNEAAANSVLGKIVAQSESGELTVTGPEDEQWAAYIVLSVPNNATLDLSSGNGEISLRGVNGQFTLRTQNGPISMVAVSGVVDCEAQNGPIQFRGHAGDIRLAAQNGPLGVKLDAPTWTGKGLDAHTTNGPVQLSAPDGMRSGVQVECSGNSPFSWNGATSFFGDEGPRSHTVLLGDGPVMVHLSTVNGPVNISGPKKSSSKKPRTI
jgi:hypothetical protein